jgi:hypothetical protein
MKPFMQKHNANSRFQTTQHIPVNAFSFCKPFLDLSILLQCNNIFTDIGLALFNVDEVYELSINLIIKQYSYNYSTL